MWLDKVIDGEQCDISKAVNWQCGGGYRFYETAGAERRIVPRDSVVPVYGNGPLKIEGWNESEAFGDIVTVFNSGDKPYRLCIPNGTGGRQYGFPSRSLISFSTVMCDISDAFNAVHTTTKLLFHIA